MRRRGLLALCNDISDFRSLLVIGILLALCTLRRTDEIAESFRPCVDASSVITLRICKFNLRIIKWELCCFDARLISNLNLFAVSLSFFLLATGFNQFSFFSQIFPFVSLLIKISSVVQMPQFTFCCSSFMLVHVDWIVRCAHTVSGPKNSNSLFSVLARKWADASAVLQRISNSNFSYIHLRWSASTAATVLFLF